MESGGTFTKLDPLGFNVAHKKCDFNSFWLYVLDISLQHVCTVSYVITRNIIIW